jgi:putative hydrolase of the HAD superfamily
LRKRGLKLGVVSNWDARLRPLLHALGLADQFEAIVVSPEVGASKPERAIFETAVKQLGVPAQIVLHVWDNFEMDMAGANAAGLRSVQVDRRASPLGEAQIGSLRDRLKSG